MAIEILKTNTIYTKAFKWITDNSTSNTLPYHNINHLLSVFSSCYDASEHYRLVDVDGKSSEIELCLAALFHDVNHSGGKLSDNENIKTAIESFENFYETLDEEEKSEFVKRVVIDTIHATEYPHNENGELSLHQRIIRDADMTSAFDGDWVQSVIFGLKEELGEESISKRIDNQINFILTLETCTEWGQSKLEGCKGRIINELANLKSMMKESEK